MTQERLGSKTFWAKSPGYMETMEKPVETTNFTEHLEQKNESPRSKNPRKKRYQVIQSDLFIP